VDDIRGLLTMYPLEGQTTEAVDEPQPDPDFAPDFDQYDVVISNFGWKASDWPQAIRDRFENYMKNGGGLVVIHAADNSWGDWEAFNQMIGLGGWGGRSQATGPYVYYDTTGVLMRDTTAGGCGSHGAQHNYVVETRAPQHPIMQGLPAQWLHAKDELYERLRGPAENMTVLATAFSDASEDEKRTARHEPVLMTVEYGKGRTFHTVMGHMDYSMECVGFIATFQRGAEWAATGEVTLPVPEDFPTASRVQKRPWLGNAQATTE
jgi:hypothetical protein